MDETTEWAAAINKRIGDLLEYCRANDCLPFAMFAIRKNKKTDTVILAAGDTQLERDRSTRRCLIDVIGTAVDMLASTEVSDGKA